MKKAVVAVLLVSSCGAGGFRVAPQLIANVSILIANYYSVDCVQIFRVGDLPLDAEEGLHKMWKTLATVESKVTTGVYTYRQYLRRKKERPRKVSCYRSLKVMSDDEGSRREYAKFSKKLSIKDAIWVLYTDSPSVAFFQDARVVFDEVIIIAEIKSESLILFHEVYRVSSNFPSKVVLLGNWTGGGGLQISDGVMYKRRSDLEGVILRTASVEVSGRKETKEEKRGEAKMTQAASAAAAAAVPLPQDWPASYRRNGKWQGFLINIWKEIQSLINCTSVEVEAENLVGMKLENGSWNGLVGMATRNEIDIIVSEVVIDKDRSRALDFFHPIMKSRFQIYTRHLGYQWQWISILNPLHASVWAAVFAWVLVATLFWTLVHRACIFHGLGPMDFDDCPSVKSFFFVMQALCQQVSSLGQKIHLKSFDSLQDMVADGTYRLMVKENTAQHAFFSLSRDKFFKLAYEKLVKPVPKAMQKFGLRESVKALCYMDNYAVMGVEDVVESRLHHLITLDCPVVHLTYPVSTVYLTMAAAKNNPYWGLINYQLGQLLSSGIVERLRRAEFPLGHGHGHDHDHGATFLKEPAVEVGIRQVVSAFLLIGCFAVVSFLLLLLEFQWSFCKTLKSESKRKKRNFRFHQVERRLALEMKMRKNARRCETP